VLTSVAQNNPGSLVDQPAVKSLAEHWPDEATRQVLTSVAQNNASGFAGQEAVQLLAEHWPDCNAPHCFVGLTSKYFVGKEGICHAVSWIADR